MRKSTLNLNTDADANVNDEMSLSKFPNGQNELLHSSFFQHDSKLNETIKLITLMTSTNIFFRKDGDSFSE